MSFAVFVALFPAGCRLISREDGIGERREPAQ